MDSKEAPVGTNNGGNLPISMLVADEVARVPADATLREVAETLVDSGVGALIVGDGPGADAVVSERDVVRALAARRDPDTTRAIEVATTELVWADGTATVTAIARLMMQEYLRHVLVQVDGQLAGIVSARDLLGVFAVTDGDAGDTSQ